MSRTWFGTRPVRAVIGGAGGLLAAFGVFRLVSEIPVGSLLALSVWLAGALVLHDAVLSPGLLGLGAVIRHAPARIRGYLQGALIAGGIVSVIAIPLIYRTGSQPRVKAILDQDFRRNLAVLFAIISVTALAGYLWRVIRERRTASSPGATDDVRPEAPPSEAH